MSEQDELEKLRGESQSVRGQISQGKMTHTQTRVVCAICHTPIRMTRRGWSHVSPLAKVRSCADLVGWIVGRAEGR